MLVSMLSDTKFKRFCIFFTDDILMEREKPALDTLKALNIDVRADNLVDMLSLNTTVIDGSNDELIILDEADNFILDSAIEINALNIVGLTATALDDLEDSAAEQYLL